MQLTAALTMMALDSPRVAIVISLMLAIIFAVVSLRVRDD